jgi:hypothetical protein
MAFADRISTRPEFPKGRSVMATARRRRAARRNAKKAVIAVEEEGPAEAIASLIGPTEGERP